MDALVVSNILLWVTVVVLCFVVLALTRQIGILHERVTPVGALATQQGLRVGEAAPHQTLTTLQGNDIEIGGTNGRTLLFFLSPTCPVCESLLPTVLRIGRQESPAIKVILASDGEPSEHRRFVSQHGLDDVPYVLSSTLGISYQVAKLPYAVLVDAQGVLRAMGLVNTREHIESLFEAERLGVASIQEFLDKREEPLSNIQTGGNA